MLASDEDEIDEDGAQYLEKLEKHINTQSNGAIEVKYSNYFSVILASLWYRLWFDKQFFDIQASIEDDSDSDDSDDEDYDGYEETSLESYTTPLDEEDTCVDEYQVFKEVSLLTFIILFSATRFYYINIFACSDFR